MLKRVSIVGATGYSGAELCALLSRHPRIEIAGLYSSEGGARCSFGSLHPSLAGCQGPEVEPFTLAGAVSARPDVMLLATPNETSARLAPVLLDAGIAVIDLSGSFRLKDPREYPMWYGFEHPAPRLLEVAVYGLTEWCNGDLSAARLVANPGCYPTSALLALKPLANQLDTDQPIVCDSKSGVSGAGRRADPAYSFAELSGNFKAYGVGAHRHEPEIRSGLELPANAAFTFAAHLLPVVRGIFSTLHVSFVRPMGPDEVAGAFERAYGQSPFVRVRPAGQLPELRDVVGSPRAEIGFVLLSGGRRAVIVCVLDNLLKGAASQAVQNLNRMLGFEETEGLYRESPPSVGVVSPFLSNIYLHALDKVGSVSDGS